MPANTLRHWIKKLGEKLQSSGSRRQSSAARRAAAAKIRPTLEPLEDRLTPSSGRTTYIAAPDTSASPVGFQPMQILEAYGFYSLSGTNNISFHGVPGNGAGQTIAIVDAYNDPNIVPDLAAFDSQFSLPAPPSFQVLNESGQTSPLPGNDNGWAVEEALDVEWSHALAPGANIVLVEASSNSYNDLFTAESTAAGLPMVSAVSNSWSGGEFSGETSYDSTFFVTPIGHQGVTFLASTGDSGSPSGYPAYSPNVVAVGGTTLNLNANNSIQTETGWSDSGGGTSVYENEPTYQDSVQSTGKRTAPDISFVADPNTGVAIYDSYDNPYGGPWTQIGGTSVSCPCWAGIVAIINQGRVANGATTLNGASQTLPGLYSLPSSAFHDITSGNNGGFSAGPGYDEVTGIGTPVINNLVPDMVAYDANPIVTPSTAGIADSSSTITIKGTLFSTTPASNTVTFNLGVVGTVTSATGTQLTVTITTPPTALGSLTAVVTSSGLGSGTAVQIGTEVSGTWLVTDPNGSGTGSFTDVTLPYAVGHALNGDEITFAGSLSGHTLTLSNVLAINTNVTITGQSAPNLVISGNNAVDVFSIGSGVTANISSVTIEYGRAVNGGGIDNLGTLTLGNSTVAANTATNEAGGIYNQGSLTLSNSTVFGNFAPAGGGIDNSAGTLTMSNSTVSGNTASGSGGGVLNLGAVTLLNAIVAGNSAGTDPDVDGTVALANYSLIGNASGATISSGTGYQLGVSAGLASSLANNGGPTQTLALLPGSAAIGAGGALTTIAVGHAVGASDTTIYVQNAAAIASAGDYYILIDSEQLLVTNVNMTTNTLTVQRGVNGTTAAAHAVGAGVFLATDQRGNGRNSTPDLGAYQLASGPGLSQTAARTALSLSALGTATLTFLDASSNTPTGTVDFLNATTNTLLGNVSLQLVNSNYVAAVSLVNLTAGPQIIQATYEGDNNFQGSSASVSLLVVVPAITSSTANLPVTATSLTINGSGFDTNAANDSVTLSNGVTDIVTAASSTSLTVSLTGLIGLAADTALAASVTVDGIGSGAAVQVATVAPVVSVSTVHLAANATSLTIFGYGFDATAAHDSVSLSNVAQTLLSVTGTVTAASSTSLTVSLTGLTSVTADTALSASVTVDSISSGAAVQVATVAPVVTSSTANLAANASTLNIAGYGFDATAAHDSVSLSNGVTGTVIVASSTSLTVSLTGLSTVTVGTALTANVTVDSISSGTAVQVATVAPANNTVITPSTASLADSSSTMTINGSGFSTTPANDTVAFNLGVVGSVSSATATQLTVAITSPPTALGSLTAVVTVNGASSGAAVPVATEVAGDWIVNDSGNGAGSLTDLTLPYAFSHYLGGDQITFASSLSGHIITLSSVLTISRNVTITGLGAANLAVSGNNAVQVFLVSSGVTAGISSLTIENGKVTAGIGAGIDNSGTLTLSNDTISGNSQAGVSGFYSSGGGIFNAGTLTLSNSTVSGNTAADYGGGVANVGVLTVTGSTFANNHSGITAGGVEDYGGTIALSNCTIFGNSAATGGGIEDFTGAMTLSNVTISGNTAGNFGGGIEINQGTMTMLNTIVAGDTSGTYPDVSGTVAVGSYDLIGNAIGLTITSSSGNRFNVSAGLAATLGNNGGPTQTLALLPGSNAIGNGEIVGGVTTDQRGIVRSSAAPDIGAFQLETVTSSTALLPATSTSLTIIGSAFDTTAAHDSVTLSNVAQTLLSVTGTVTAATSTSLTVSLTGLSTVAGDTALTAVVTVDGISSGAAVQVATVEPVVTSSTASLAATDASLTIAGFGFDATAAHDVVTLSNGVNGTVTAATSTSLTVSLTGLSTVTTGTALTAVVTVDGISNGSAAQVATVAPAVSVSTTNLPDSSTTITINGGGFSTTPASDSVAFNLGVVGSVTSATAAQLTVAISAPPTSLGSLTAVVTTNGISTTAVQVATEVAGDWIVSDSGGGPGSLTDVTLPYAVSHYLSGDQISFAGSLSGHTITLVGSLTINHNVTITGLGAANLAISGNNAFEVFNIVSAATVSMSSLTVENGKVTGSGGGIHNAGTLTLTNATISSNTASVNGGGIYNTGSAVLSNDTITGNLDTSTVSSGGGINNAGSGTLTLSSSTVSGNSAGEYGAGIANDGVMTVTGTTIANNSAPSSGGGIDNYGGTLTLSNSTVFNNHVSNANSYGGGVTNISNGAKTAQLTLNDDTVYGNSAHEGGGIDDFSGTMSVLNSILAGNTATFGPDIYLLTGTIAQANYDLIDNSSGATITGTGNLLNVSAGLSTTLASNGGPTQTLALLPGSNAIGDGEIVAGLTTDQRGISRGTAPDIGAFQLETLTSSTALLPANSTSLTIDGTGFDTTAANDSVTLSNVAQTLLSVTGTVTAATSTSLTVSLTGLSTVAGDTALTAVVTVDGISSGAVVQVATVEPVVTSNTASLAATTTSLTIAGFGFDATAANDVLTLSNVAQTLLSVTGTVTAATGTSLTVSLTGLSTVTVGTALTAVVTVDGISNGTATQIATVVPGVSVSTTSLADNSTTITINGADFSTTPAGNTVAFNLGVVGTVTSATATQLTVAISTPPTALGSLTAVVTANGGNSGTPVQVATEISADWIVTDAGNGAGSLTDLTLPYAVIHALNGDQITFASSLSGATITLSSALTIGHSITITGLGAANLFISGNNATGVFAVNPAVTAGISNLTVENGKAAVFGVGIANRGVLTLSNDVISGNTDTSAIGDSSGGGIYNYSGGTLILSNSTLSGNSAEYGGAIANSGVMTVTNTTISNNAAGSSAGGVENYGGTLTMSNSTVSNNHITSSTWGGGIVNYSESPTMVAQMTLSNDTIFGNSAAEGGGVTNYSGTLTLSNDTLSGNFGNSLAGGILNNSGAVTTLLNTIVAGNTASTDPDGSGTFAAANNDLIGNAAGVTISSGTDNVLNPGFVGLSSLGNYGGPTQTMALLPGSPAIDAGNNNGAPSTDQRGEPRPGFGSTVDIGAFESQGFTFAIVSGNNQATGLSSPFAPLVVSVTANNAGEPVNGGQVAYTVTPAADGASDALATSPATIGGGQASVAPTANAQAGAYTVTASASGAAAVAFNLMNQPGLNSSSANLSVTATTLTIFGAGFDTTTANDSVSFDNGVTGTVTSASGTSLTVSLTGLSSVSDGAALHASVTTDGAGSGSAVQVAIVYAPPVANGRSLSTNENTAVSGTLTGSDADNTPLTTYTVVSNPANGSLTSFNASTGTFTYTPTTGYTGADNFTFTVSDGTNTSAAATVSITVVGTQTAPAVSGLSPTSGLAGGGTSVVITGTGFTAATAVDFGSTAATTFTVNSATQITATDPAGSGVVDVMVATSAGTSATSSADNFTYAAVSGVKVNGDVAPIVDISSNGAGTVTATTDGNNGFTAGDLVVISGYTAANTTGYNGTFTIGTASGDTFTVTNATAGLTTLTNNNLGLAVSQNTTSGLIGSQRSMVDSVAYTFSAPVTGLTAANFTLSAAASAIGLITSGSATAATTAPGMTLTSLDGGSIWVVTWSGLSASVGHSIADGVYELTLGNSGRATDTFYRLFANVVGYQSSSAHINSTDSLDFSHSYLLGTGAATYLADCDYNADGLVNSTDSLQLSHRYLSVWTGFTPTI